MQSSIMHSMTSAQFFEAWIHALEHDFQKDGTPASYPTGRPQQWGSETAKIEVGRKPSVVALSSDQSLIAVAVEGDVLIYDRNTLHLRQTLQGFGTNHGSMSLRFRPNSHHLAVGYTLRHENRLQNVIRFWQLDDELANHLARVDDGGADPIGGSVAAAAGSVSLSLRRSAGWSEEDVEAADLSNEFLKVIRRAQVQVDIRRKRAFPGTLQGAFSHDGSFLLYVNDHNVIVRMDMDTLEERYRLTDHADMVMWAATSPDDRIVASVSWDRTVRLWDATTGDALRTLTGATNQCWKGAFSPDGKLLAVGSGDESVRIWDVNSGELMHTLGGFSSWVRSLAFSPDGRSLAAGAGNGTLRVFDIHSGESTQLWEITSAQRHRSFIEIKNVMYTSRGDLIFKSPDGRVFMYDAEKNIKGDYEPDSSAEKCGGYGNAVVSGDGRTILSADHDGAVRLWELD